MTMPFLAGSLATDRLALSTATKAAVNHRLTLILESLLRDPPGRLPNWPYRTWYRVLQYPDLNPRAHGITRELGRRREQAFSHPALHDLVQWAGTRRRDDPTAGAAAALTTVGAVLAHDDLVGPSAPELARAVAASVDDAQPVRSSWRRPARAKLVADLDLLASVDPERPDNENPLVSAAVRDLLCLAGIDLDASLRRRVEGAVVQAGDWWARHAVPVPTSVDGPPLPGIVPAQRLRDTDRISAYVSDAPLLHLVTGPHPGRGRPSQVAWRRGLTYWTAASLVEGRVQRPPYEVLRWWQSQLASVDRQNQHAVHPTAKARATAAS